MSIELEAKLENKGWTLKKSKQTRFAPTGILWEWFVGSQCKGNDITNVRSMLFTVCGPQVSPLVDSGYSYLLQTG